jgi:3-hydroxymyristoyl/3-hydroxydecanoyl-(acyl carrier protein) dehydratase
MTKQTKTMTSDLTSSTLETLWDEQSRRSRALHSRFLETRQASLLRIEDLLRMQYTGVSALQKAAPAIQPPAPARFTSSQQGTNHRPVVYDRAQLAEFATGRVSACFGPDFSIFDGQRVPRIPSGELMLMTRVTEIQGQRNDFTVPASIVTEYDAAPDDWFFLENTYSGTPYSVLMEMALQPCGLLSAHLGTMRLFPVGADAEVRLFRNLDGFAVLLATPDLRGKTVTASARMLAHIASGPTVIQKFSFELSCEGVPFYRGESTFGYFSEAAMQAQAGLDRGAAALRWTDQYPAAVPAPARPPAAPGSYLDLLETVSLYPGGAFGQGCAAGQRAVHPADWFYRCHFLGDPVMPGSLGVEAMLQAIQAWALQSGLVRPDARFALATGQRVEWKYRGQITPAHRQMNLEAHLHPAAPGPQGTTLTANASLWVDSLRIYEVKGLGFRVS